MPIVALVVREVKLGEFGHDVHWIDIGSANLRRRAERQAEVLRLAG